MAFYEKSEREPFEAKSHQIDDEEDLRVNPDVQRWIRNKLRNRQWGESWMGSFILGFLGATDDGVFFVIFYYMSMYMTVSIGWMLFLGIRAVAVEIALRSFTLAFNPIQFLIAFITRDLINAATQRTTSTSKLYVTLLRQIKEFTVLMSGVRDSIVATPRGKHYAKMGDTPEYEETRANALLHIENIRGYVMVLVRFSYRLFTHVDEAVDHTVFDFGRYEVLAEFAFGKSRMYMSDSTIVYEGALANITKEMVHMNERDILGSAVFTASYSVIKDINHTVGEIWISQNINPPAIFGRIYDAILKFYLFVMVPLQVISATNRYWQLLIYPVVILIYTVPIILGDWLRSPFNPNSRWEGPPLMAYRNLMYRQVENLIGDPHKHKYINAPLVLTSPIETVHGISTLLE